jgi:ferric-dicitrate binding protein FerR (iron transport regulator)
MAAKYQMQAKDSISGLVTWRSEAPDWAAVGAPGVGSIDLDSIAVSGGGFDTSSDTSPTNAVTLTDGSRVTLSDGSFATVSS